MVENLLRLDITVSAETLELGAAAVISGIRPHWPQNRIKYQVFTDGITNKLIGCSLEDDPEDTILVRVYGHNTDLLIDREAETNNFVVLHNAGYAPKVYATFENGIAYEFIPGEVLTPLKVICPTIFPNIAKMMAKFHKVDGGSDNTRRPVLWDKIKHYLSLIPNEYQSSPINKKFCGCFPGGMKTLENEIIYLENQLSSLNNVVVFCHNDLLLANIICDKEKITFIDYEYAAYNYQAYDIGNHFAEYAGVSEVDYSRYPSKEFQLKWLEIYLKEFKKCSNDTTKLEQSEIELLYVHVNKFSLVSHLLWATWALVQAHHSTINFDFIQYAGVRMKEYLSKRDIFLSLK